MNERRATTPSGDGEQVRSDAEVLIEGLRDLLGPANNLLERFIEHTGESPAMTAAFQEHSAAALFTGRFEEWRTSFEAFRQAFNKNLEDSKNLLKALDYMLEKGPDLGQKERDNLVGFRTSIANLADNQPIEAIPEESYDPECAADCTCKQ